MLHETDREYMTYARTALKNNNREEALRWLGEELKIRPDNTEAILLSGNLWVELKKYDMAKNCFRRACELDPDSGERHFLLGNVYLLEGDTGRAFELFADAEMKGVSDSVRPQLYYQLAMICSSRGDHRSALVNFRKYEEYDTTGESRMSPEVICEKLKMYVLDGDRENAMKCAVRLISLSPARFGAYMTYYTLLMSEKEFDKAEKVLEEAEKYAELSDSDRFTLTVERVNLMTERAEAEKTDGVKQAELFNEAYTYLSELLDKAPLSRQNELGLKLAELCMKRGEYMEAIAIASVFLPSENVREIHIPVETSDRIVLNDIDMEYREMQDTEMISQMIASGEISDMFDDFAEINYDEHGNPVKIYPQELLRAAERTAKKEMSAGAEEKPADTSDAAELKREERDKLYYVLTKCYSALGDYRNALKYGGILKYSENDHHSNYGRYIEAFSKMKLVGTSPEYTKESAEEAYDDTISYYRFQMMNGGKSSYPVIYRARMYAESGKYVKAEQLANLLPKEKAGLMEYIGKCKAGTI